ncbi:Holliday junction ATP-dependent DNA helicase RuvA [Peptoniphilus sp. ING2-D1G]|nr:Holliday junction ATP-dependent DNA helicase RuvA [Peptoniphilus sp. ING2-D1G]
MIDFLKGTIAKISLKYIILECGNIGYLVNMSENQIRELMTGEEIKIYTRLILREDSATLYGFLDEQYRDLFDLLTTVSSIGPKVGIGILSSLNLNEIIRSIRKSDIDILTRAPGVGKKTAQRIILELKDKISNFEFEEKEENIEDTVSGKGLKEPAIEALISLGYNEFEARKALSNVDENLEISKMIKQALKNLGR